MNRDARHWFEPQAHCRNNSYSNRQLPWRCLKSLPCSRTSLGLHAAFLAQSELV